MGVWLIHLVSTNKAADRKAKMVTQLIVNPTASNSFLLHKVGVWLERPMQEPIYEKGKSRGAIIGYKTTAEKVSVFHLFGFGSTEEKAWAMAAKECRTGARRICAQFNAIEKRRANVK